MKLTEEQKQYIVCQFAIFKRTWQICHSFRDTYGEEITAAQVSNFDIAKRLKGQRSIAKWVPMFDAARAKFLADVASVPVANATYRIHQLDEMFDIAFKKKNYVAAAKLLEQAAKETGGAYTNQRELSAKIDADVSVSDESAIPMVVKRDMLAHRLRAAVALALAENDKPVVAPKNLN